MMMMMMMMTTTASMMAKDDGRCRLCDGPLVFFILFLVWRMFLASKMRAGKKMNK